MSTDSRGGEREDPHHQRRLGQAGPQGKLPASHQGSASGDGHCPASGARFAESCCEELCPAPDRDTSELVRRQRAWARQDLGPQCGDPIAPEPHSHLCSFNIQMCVGATGHNVPKKLREWHHGDRREVDLGSPGGWPGRP